MDQRERLNDPHEAFKLLLDGRQLRMWTSLPGIIQKFYPDKQTVDVQPSIMGVITDAGGNTKNVNLPKLLDCPVQFPSGGAGGTTGQQSIGGSTGSTSTNPIGLGSTSSLGGLGNTGGLTSGTGGISSISGLGTSSSGLGGLSSGSGLTSSGTGLGGVGIGSQQYGVTLTFPVQAGDECLIVFTSRGFDNWWQSGGIQPPMEARMHDLSDGFVFLGFRSQPRKLSPGVSTTTCQLRSDDGQTLLELDAKNKKISLRNAATTEFLTADFNQGTLNTTFNTSVDVKAPNIKLDGQVNITGQLTVGQGITAANDIVAGTVSLETHVHSGVMGGPGTSGPPVGGGGGGGGTGGGGTGTGTGGGTGTVAPGTVGTAGTTTPLISNGYMVNNNSALRGIIGTPGSQASTLGNSSIADGGGGTFFWNPNSTASDDNINTIIPTGSTTGAWSRIGTLLASTSVPSQIISDLGYTPINKNGDSMVQALSGPDPTSSGQYATKNYVDTQITAVQSGQSIIQPIINGGLIATSNFQLSQNQTYGANTSALSLNLLLPLISSVHVGAIIEVQDIDYDAFTNNITVNSAGGDVIKFQNTTSSTFIMNINGITARFRANGTYWRATFYGS